MSIYIPGDSGIQRLRDFGVEWCSNLGDSVGPDTSLRGVKIKEC